MQPIFRGRGRPRLSPHQQNTIVEARLMGHTWSATARLAGCSLSAAQTYGAHVPQARRLNRVAKMNTKSGNVLDYVKFTHPFIGNVAACGPHRIHVRHTKQHAMAKLAKRHK